MTTKNFRTRQEFIKEEHPKTKDFIIGLDAGYSSMKVFTEKGYFSFPSYAKKIEKDSMINLKSKKDIRFRDFETGDEYLVGYSAQEMLSDEDTNETESEMFARNRYNTEQFNILSKTAIGLALWLGDYDPSSGRKIIIQTGLPTAYMGDSKGLIQALSHPAKFELCTSKDWIPFNYAINKDQINVIPQPYGSLYSVVIDDNGRFVSDANEKLLSDVLVMDIGFGTFDFFGIKSRKKTDLNSINNIGMHEVFKRISQRIMDEIGEDIRPQALQKYLETGEIEYIDEENFSSDVCDISAWVEDASEAVFQEAMRKARSATNSFRGYKYIIVAGGTGGAWLEKIKKYFANMKSITVLDSTRNTEIPYIYSNVRGYYLSQYIQCITKEMKSK